MSKVQGSNKQTMGSIRAKAGQIAKAGRRRPPHLQSYWEERKVNGRIEKKRHWR